MQYVIPLMSGFVASKSLLLHATGVTSAFWVFPDVSPEALCTLNTCYIQIRKCKQTGTGDFPIAYNIVPTALMTKIQLKEKKNKLKERITLLAVQYLGISIKYSRVENALTSHVLYYIHERFFFFIQGFAIPSHASGFMQLSPLAFLWR